MKDMARPDDDGHVADGGGGTGGADRDEAPEGSRPSATASGPGLSYREVGWDPG